MAADNLWWSVWWPWLLIWTGTVLALVLAVAVTVVQWRSQQRRSKQPPNVSFYLHGQSVMDLYQYKYRGALEQEVEARVGARASVNLGADAPMVKFGGNLERNRDEFRKYLEIASPITVIGILMDVLEDDLIYVDLERGTLEPGGNVDLAQRKARLSELGGRTYILARGRFHANATTANSTTFLAAYGQPASSIRVQCLNTGLRNDVPEDQFWARCLGAVRGWDRASGHLIIDPIAIFT